MNQPAPARLLLDEMLCPVIAAAWGRWLLTENVKDFQPILQQARQTGAPAAGPLLTSSRAFPRSRRNPGLAFQSTR
jgi:hypothetical protein